MISNETIFLFVGKDFMKRKLFLNTPIEKIRPFNNFETILLMM